MRTCPHCEGQVSDTARKCKHCGNWVVEEDSSSRYTEQESVVKRPPRKRLAVWLIALTVFCFGMPLFPVWDYDGWARLTDRRHGLFDGDGRPFFWDSDYTDGCHSEYLQSTAFSRPLLCWTFLRRGEPLYYRGGIVQTLFGQIFSVGTVLVSLGTVLVVRGLGAWNRAPRPRWFYASASAILATAGVEMAHLDEYVLYELGRWIITLTTGVLLLGAAIVLHFVRWKLSRVKE